MNEIPVSQEAQIYSLCVKRAWKKPEKYFNEKSCYSQNVPRNFLQAIIKK